MTATNGIPSVVLPLVAIWSLYFFVHSALASLTLKRWVAARRPQMMPRYRVVFNLVALIGLVPPVVVTYALQGPPLWQWSGGFRWLADGLAVASIIGFIWSLKYYDGSEFLGLRQWRSGNPEVGDQEIFKISPLHRFVRHPWYSLALILVWSRDMDLAFLTSASAITLYFMVGSRLEERKLEIYHGEIYRRYRARVPAFLPSPWRFLDQKQAAKLLNDYVNRKS